MTVNCCIKIPDNGKAAYVLIDIEIVGGGHVIKKEAENI
jgi:hypothetical protein